MTDGLLARQEILLDNFHSLNETLKEEKAEIARVEKLLTNQTIELVQLEHGERELFTGLTELQSKFDTVKTEFNSNDKNVQRDLDKLEKNMVNMEQELRETIKKHSVEVFILLFFQDHYQQIASWDRHFATCIVEFLIDKKLKFCAY